MVENRVARKQIHVELKYAPRVQCPPNVLLLPADNGGGGGGRGGGRGSGGEEKDKRGVAGKQVADFNVTCTVGE